MTSISQHVPNYIQGISDQADELKQPGQVRDALNVFPDVTFGLMKRPATRYMEQLTCGDTAVGSWFSYFRDDVEDGREEYIGRIGYNGQVCMWDGITGASIPVCYSTDPVFRFPNKVRSSLYDLDCNATTFPDYLVHTERHQLQMTTVNDFTFVTNRTVLPAMGPIANDVPDYWEGFIDLRLIAFGRTYTVEFKNLDGSTIVVAQTTTPGTGGTQISAETILNDLEQDIIGAGGFTNVEIIGNGIYMRRATAFTIETPEAQLINVLSPNQEDNTPNQVSKFTYVNDVSQLPLQCWHGFLVKVVNSTEEVDDLYLRFQGNFDRNGEGAWEETVRPGLRNTFDYDTMPWQIVRDFDAQGNVQFTVSPIDWEPRLVGDETTNPRPSFAPNSEDETDARPINKILFYRNRLVFLSDENVVMSRASDFFNLWVKSALNIAAIDPIDVAVSNTYASVLTDGVVMSTGLILFSEFQQFLLRTENDVLSPTSIKVSTLASYDYKVETNPIQMGTSIGFLSEGGTSSRFYEMTNLFSDSEPDVLEQSKVVNRRLPAGLDMIADSRENGLIVFAEHGENYAWCFRYFNAGQKRLQSAWFRWDFIGNILHHSIIGDRYYAVTEVDGDVYLSVLDLKDRLSAVGLNGSEFDYRVHLDYYAEVEVADMTPVERTRVLKDGTTETSVISTTFPLPVPYFDDKNLVAYSLENGNERGKMVTIDAAMIGSNIVTLPGDWTQDTLAVGYTYQMLVTFPTFYVQKSEGGAYKSDIHSSLVIHRLKLSFGSVGLYETTISRLGADDYTVEYEAKPMDLYQANRIPYMPEMFSTVSVYDRNTSFLASLSSVHPGPATLNSLTWEGDYTSRYYKRV